MCRIGLYDTIAISFGGPGIEMICDHPQVPADVTNLVHRAASLFFDWYEKKRGGHPEGLCITLNKKIPVGAGLGGGSSNAASILQGLNQHYHHPFSTEVLCEMGLSLGADVPFFIYNRPAIAAGIGEILSPAPSLQPFSVLLVDPDVFVSTALVYKNLNLGLTNLKKENKNLPFKMRNFDPKKHLWNDLEAVTCAMVPDILRIKRLLMEHGAQGSLMSGSGSAVFGIFSDLEGAMAAKESLLGYNERWQLHAVNALV